MRRPLIVLTLCGEHDQISDMIIIMFDMKIAFYYSTRRKGLIVKIRNPHTARDVENEAKALGLEIHKRYDY